MEEFSITLQVLVQKCKKQNFEEKRGLSAVFLHMSTGDFKPTEALEGHFYLLVITYYLLLITYHLLLITYYLLLITYYLLLIISFLTPITAGNSIVHSL